MLSKKDIVEINKAFHNGKIVNNSSLEFAVQELQRSKNWLKACAVLARAIIIDHIFEDGNKRTAVGTIATIMEMNEAGFSPERLNKAVLTIAKQNITSIREIEKVIANARE